MKHDLAELVAMLPMFCAISLLYCLWKDLNIISILFERKICKRNICFAIYVDTRNLRFSIFHLNLFTSFAKRRLELAHFSENMKFLRPLKINFGTEIEWITQNNDHWGDIVNNSFTFGTSSTSRPVISHQSFRKCLSEIYCFYYNV